MSNFIKRNFVTGDLRYGKKQQDLQLMQSVIVRVEQPIKKPSVWSKLWPFGRKK
jgi:hypothetical protein